MFSYGFSTLFPEYSPRGGLLEILTLWRNRARQRRSLARLDDRLLRDAGISRADALREVHKPFWEA